MKLQMVRTAPWLLALAALTILRLVLAANLPLAPDEAYYWIWSTHLQPGYFDHPPMVAICIRAGTSLLGNTPLGIRLLGPLAAAAGSVLLWCAAEDILPNRQAGATSTLLFNATLITGAGAVIMTPDTPLLFFWCATLAALGRLLAGGKNSWWLVVGMAAGAAMLSKYTGLLLAASIAFWLISRPDGRTSLKTIWPWIGLLLAALIFAPDIAWNASHHWVSFFKQGGRITQFNIAHSTQYFAELVVSQIGLATPGVFALAAYGTWQLRRAGDQGSKLLLWLILLPAAVFIQHIISGRVQANWPAIIFVPGVIAAASLPPAVLSKWRYPACAVGFLFCLAVYAQALFVVFPIPPKHDPAALQLAGWAGLASQATALNPAFVTADDYATLAELAFYAPPGITIIAAEPRWHYLELQSALPGTHGVALLRHSEFCAKPLGQAIRRRGNSAAMAYNLCAITPPAGSLVLPRP